MKKVFKLLSLFVLVCSFTMAGEYIPGTYRASGQVAHRKGFIYTNFIVMEVSEKGSIENVYIDATFPVDANDLAKQSRSWEIEKEWNEQADSIAAHVIENQGVAFKVNDDKTTDDIAGATVKVHCYIPLLEEVVSKAKVM